MEQELCLFFLINSEYCNITNIIFSGDVRHYCDFIDKLNKTHPRISDDECIIKEILE